MQVSGGRHKGLACRVVELLPQKEHRSSEGARSHCVYVLCKRVDVCTVVASAIFLLIVVNVCVCLCACVCECEYVHKLAIHSLQQLKSFSIKDV
jgi:hypothetical protein